VKTLGLDFPVYVILTKADKIPYFGDYFARLRNPEDQQVLGCTLNTQPQGTEVYAEAETKRLTSFSNALYYSLTAQASPVAPKRGG